MHKNLMVFRWRRYRPKPKVVSNVLVKRFCAKCLRIYGLGRSFKPIRSRCGVCPVLEALSAVDPKLRKVRKELEELKRKGW